MELKSLVFKTLYGWIVTLNRSHFSSFQEFLDLCSSSFFPIGCTSCILSVSGLHLPIRLIYIIYNKADLIILLTSKVF
jgi:hypothetical protein